jgi:hypothetical protein
MGACRRHPTHTGNASTAHAHQWRERRARQRLGRRATWPRPSRDGGAPPRLSLPGGPVPPRDWKRGRVLDAGPRPMTTVHVCGHISRSRTPVERHSHQPLTPCWLAPRIVYLDELQRRTCRAATRRCTARGSRPQGTAGGGQGSHDVCVLT